MDGFPLIPLLIGLVGGGGVVGMITALIKVRPEAQQIIVTTAQGALLIATGVIDELKEELDRKDESYVKEFKRQDEKIQRYIGKIEHLEKEIEKCDELRRQIGLLNDRIKGLEDELERTRVERNELASEKSALEQRVKDLEKEVRQLKAKGETNGI